jgi:DNA end-binding protein Ku
VLEDVGEPAAASGGNVIDLMAALKASVEGSKPSGRKAANDEETKPKVRAATKPVSATKKPAARRTGGKAA